MRPAQVVNLGLVNYVEAQQLQEQLVDARKREQIPDTLLLLRHPDVITLGRAGSRKFLRCPESALPMPVVEAGRGGEVTFHGPGQLVIYPILKLQELERDLHLYLRRLEEVAIRVCQGFALSTGRVEGRTGVWSGGRKIAAIGVRARSWVTFHGMAFNLTDDLKGFDYIVPCGIEDAGVTSLEGELGCEVPLGVLAKRMCQQFAEVYSRELEEVSVERFLSFKGDDLG